MRTGVLSFVLAAGLLGGSTLWAGCSSDDDSGAVFSNAGGGAGSGGSSAGAGGSTAGTGGATAGTAGSGGATAGTGGVSVFGGSGGTPAAGASGTTGGSGGTPAAGTGGTSNPEAGAGGTPAAGSGGTPAAGKGGTSSGGSAGAAGSTGISQACETCAFTDCQSEVSNCLGDTVCSGCLQDFSDPACQSNANVQTALVCVCDKCATDCTLCGAIGGQGGAGGGSQGGIPPACQSCAANMCQSEGINCYGDSACAACLSNPSDPSCGDNVAFQGLLGCACDNCSDGCAPLCGAQ